ncbi:MAG: enoyl-CoA hydratase-related protein [Chloroflexota bacterium]
MTHKTVLFDLDDNVAVITLNRPDVGNAFDLTLSKELYGAALECASNPEVRAVVITGAGKLFSGGGDLGFFNAQENIQKSLLEMTTYIHGAQSRFNRMNAPVIAAVNGTAGGGGFSLMCSCDLIIAADHAKFTMAYTAAGLTPDASSTYFLPRLIGHRRAAEMVLTNRRLTAAEAVDWGLINQAVPAEELMPTVMKLAKQLAQGPTASYGKAMELIRKSFDNSLETQMEEEAQAISTFAGSDNVKEGIAAFSEKRKPNFK